MVVDTPSPAQLDRVFHALADATRRDIVQTAFRGEHCVSELARRYPISLPAVQKHVAVLERAGLVSKRRHGREQLVSADIAAIRQTQCLLDQLEEVWRSRIGRIESILTDDSEGALP